MGLDSNGIWQYTETDLVNPNFSSLLNKGTQSISDVLTNKHSTLTKFTQTTAQTIAANSVVNVGNFDSGVVYNGSTPCATKSGSNIVAATAGVYLCQFAAAFTGALAGSRSFIQFGTRINVVAGEDTAGVLYLVYAAAGGVLGVPQVYTNGIPMTTVPAVTTLSVTRLF